MLKRVLILLLLIINSATSNLKSQDVVQKIDRLVSDYYNCGEFNGVVLVSRGGKIIYNKEFGLSDREWNTKMTIDTRFKIASLSKPFTALAVLQLVQEGKLRLD